jgi:FHA domain
MELVFEITSRSGRSIERHKLQGDEISIGRAYDNQLILSDETVSPHHALITADSKGHIIIRDLDSINGISNGNHERFHGDITLVSGNEYLLGKTRIRIFTLDHQIAEAVSLSNIDWTINYFARNWVTFGAMLMLILLMVAETWMETDSEFKLESYINPIFGALALTIFAALFWGLISRIVKHEMRFKAQFTVISLYVVLAFCSIYLYEFVLFNSMNYIITVSFYVFITIVLLAVLFWFNLHIATYQSNAQRWKIAIFLSATIVILSMFSDVIERTEFSLDPHYIAEIKPPILRVVSGADIDKFIQNSSSIFEHE